MKVRTSPESVADDAPMTSILSPVDRPLTAGMFDKLRFIAEGESANEPVPPVFSKLIVEPLSKEALSVPTS